MKFPSTELQNFRIQDFRSPTLSPRPFPPRRAGKGANSPIWQTLLNEVLPAVRQWAGSQADGWLGYGERARNNVTLTPIVPIVLSPLRLNTLPSGG